ncbi:cyclic dehypoxanthinyl futalosine synthase [Blastopirellula retiformator]|uniref:Cyclic dehypoxanthine futalosine synthase n=1 Tax=Blastopirellula retiformator TaxID=2527970 RepID=A0A5C5UW93_9BACT|nr:cyclic dehypoxanthinyl futalosine synthase [Blastopirellula retiformator]TWT29893.1 Aminodeoxyfutalosine synthase [Blastopirellula retiformator]
MIAKLLDKAVAGERLTPAEGLQLLQSHDLVALGRAADAVTRRLHPEDYRTYNIDRNINYTNVCTAVCDFCAFYRGPKSEEGYVLSQDQLVAKVQETLELGGEQILLQGGLHPSFKLEWYEEMLSDLKRRFPTVNLHAFSPPEIYHFTKVNKLSLREVLSRLKDAGLGSLPGGGAEILVDRVRNEITRGKVMTDDWLDVMRVWHELGGRSSATMMFGHVETLEERIEHLERVRQLQDETGGFTAFICWTFQPDHTDMADIAPSGSFEYLKTQAVSRLYLDNIQNVQSSWVTQGLKMGQLALLYGANDMGSLMIEENVVAEAGTVHYLTLDQIRDSISELGFTPRQRNVHYQLIPVEQEVKAIEANRARDQQLLQLA